MDISIFGMGYVGCVSAACLARDGHRVVGVDVNPDKVDQINRGYTPVIEPGLAELIAQAAQAERLSATTDGTAAIRATELSLICVGTPSRGNGSLNLDYVTAVAREIGTAMAGKPSYHTVAVRSTVLPGTLREAVLPSLADASGRAPGHGFGLAANPEFLREGSAIRDYDQPSFVVIGELDAASGAPVAALYAGIDAPMVRTSIEEAEMLKYACNAFHAVKVVFGNEIGSLCKAHGIDGQALMDTFCLDRQLNIAPTYLRPGFAYGGSCLPKDTRALAYRAKERDVDVPLISASLASNTRQIQRGIETIEALGRKRIGVVGLSFKAGTDDVRESPVVPVIETLVGRGYRVSVYDDQVAPAQLVGANKLFLEREIPHIASIMCPSMETVIAEAEVVVLTHNGPTARRALDLLRPDQALVDFVGAARGNGHQAEVYHGLGW